MAMISRGCEALILRSCLEVPRQPNRSRSSFAIEAARSPLETRCVEALPWDVVVTKEMLPSHEAITAFETELEEVASGYGGRNDGWGCFAQKD